MAIFARSAKTRIFWKSAKAESQEIFQTSLKKYPLVERLKSTVAQKALPCMQNADKFQRLEKILAQTAAPEVPAWPSYGNFRKVTQNPQFLKKWKGETRGYFSKFAQKVAVV